MSPTVQSTLTAIGGIYVAVSTVALFVPRTTAVGRFLARAALDLKGIIEAFGGKP